jgi:hypothetical protein
MRVSRPVRVRRAYTQHLDGAPADVFPLLCPVREADWVPGWDPRLVLSASGVAEKDCAFTTVDGDREATWVVTEHDPARHFVEMVKVIPEHSVTRLSIQLRAAPGAACEADVTYAWTALSDVGEAFVRGRTEEAWLAFMRGWEDELNTYLRRSRPG